MTKKNYSFLYQKYSKSTFLLKSNHKKAYLPSRDSKNNI